MNSLPPIINWALENYKLPKTKDLHKALYKIYVISTKHNTIKSYYAKPLWGKSKGETECCFIRRKNFWNFQFWLDQILNTLLFYSKFINSEF